MLVNFTEECFKCGSIMTAEKEINNNEIALCELSDIQFVCDSCSTIYQVGDIDIFSEQEI